MPTLHLGDGDSSGELGSWNAYCQQPFFTSLFDNSNRDVLGSRCRSHLVPRVVQDGPIVHTLTGPSATLQDL